MTDYNIHLGIDWKIFAISVLLLIERAGWLLKRLHIGLSDWIENDLKRAGWKRK